MADDQDSEDERRKPDFDVQGINCRELRQKQGTPLIKVGVGHGLPKAEQRAFRLSKLPEDGSRKRQVRDQAWFEAIKQAVARLQGGQSCPPAMPSQPADQEEFEAPQPAPDVSMDDASNLPGRLESQPWFRHCQLCQSSCDDGECEPALELPDGGFICESCAAEPGMADSVGTAAKATLEARASAAAAQSPPTPPALEPRRSGRAVRPPTQIYDLERGGPGQPQWSKYDLERLDKQHGRTRDETYSEVQAARDKLQSEVELARRENSDLSAKLDGVFGRLRRLVEPSGELEFDDLTTAAAVVLREAISELTDFYERPQADAPAEQADAAADAAAGEHAGEHAEATATTSVTDDEMQMLAEWTASAPVRMGGVDGTVGNLSLGGGYVQWAPISGADDTPLQHLPFSDVLYANIDEHDEVSAGIIAPLVCAADLSLLCCVCRTLLCATSWLFEWMMAESSCFTSNEPAAAWHSEMSLSAVSMQQRQRCSELLMRLVRHPRRRRPLRWAAQRSVESKVVSRREQR